MNTVTLTLGNLVDLALEDLQSFQEAGRPVTRVEAISASDTTCTFVDHQYINVSDIVEFDTELVRVTGKTADATPIFTIARGVYGTTAATHGANDTGLVNPQWNRLRVARAVIRAFPRLEAYGLQLLESEVLSPEEAVSERSLILTVPSETREVVSVRSDVTEVPRWEFIDDMSTSDYPTGKVVRLPRTATLSDEYTVVYRIPYRWSTFPNTPDESATIEVPEGTEDLPSGYAVCLLISNREISRSEIDRVAEWQQGEPQRGGVSLSLVRYRWQEFYRAVDEARRLGPHRVRRPVIRRTR